MTIVVNNWRLDPTRNALIHVETGEVRRLGEYHYALLVTFISHANNVLSRQYLMAEVWKNRVVGTNSLPTAIHALRTALDDNGKQQEIIKTVPKKGYVFSKMFISEATGNEHASTDPNPLPGQAFEPAREAGETASPSRVESEPSASAAPTAQAARRFGLAGWVAGGAILVGLALAGFYGLKPAAPPVTPPMQLKNESYPAVDRIMIMHVVSTSQSESSTPSLQNHLAPALNTLNQLLAKNEKTATIFYHVSPAVLSLNILVNNQCNQTWQNIISMDSWQGHETEAGELLISRTERTINEMPACEQ